MFRWRWFHKIVRRHTKPIAEEKALLWKKRLNFLYIFFAWNAVGIALYKCTNSSQINEMSSARSFANLLNIEDAHVIRMSGLKVVDTYDIRKPSNEKNIKEESEELFFNTDKVLSKLDSQENEVIFAKGD